jgi:hydrogenase nickel incorporation protein HypB
MCLECGCGLPGPTKINGNQEDGVNVPVTPQHSHTFTHSHEDEHDHPHRHVEVQQSILTANDRLAERNRGFFRALDLLVLNVLSSPGSGKTTFLQKTIELMGDSVRCGVIVGDLETDNDARRLRTTGVPVVQISTGTLCHLDAEMVARAVEEVGPKTLDVLFIENVGNLVCPSGFDLGEDLRVALLSVTEGEDKPLKYPPLFRFADIVVVTKVDLSAVCEFDRKTALDNIRLVNPKAQLFEVSAKTGDGMEAWRKYIVELHPQHNPKR